MIYLKTREKENMYEWVQTETTISKKKDEAIKEACYGGLCCPFSCLIPFLFCFVLNVPLGL